MNEQNSLKEDKGINVTIEPKTLTYKDIEQKNQMVNKNIDNSELSNDVLKHTASMWKYNPVPTDEPEPFEEYISKKISLENNIVFGARVRGKKHKHDGSNCDDWFEIENIGKISIVAVADGAGSKKFSRIGAMESCKSSVNYIKDNINKNLKEETFLKKLSSNIKSEEFVSSCSILANIIQNAVIVAYEAVEKAFEERKAKYDYLKLIDRDMQIKDFSGTLLLAIIIPILVDEKEEKLIVSFQIGDGMIVAINKDANYESCINVLGNIDSGEFSGETDFLTSEKMKKKEVLMTKTKILRKPVSEIFIMTDGVADDYFPSLPQALRLYMDLVVNNLIEIDNDEELENDVAQNIPEPLYYPWVNNKNESIPIQYTNKIMEKLKISIENVWNKKSILKFASFALKDSIKDKDIENRLIKWLDNYTERGSFDDRTLVIYTNKSNGVIVDGQSS